MRRALILVTLLGCSKDEAAKPPPPSKKAAPAIDAAPQPKPAPIALTEVDAAVTQDVTATVLVVVKRDGALSVIPRPELGPLELAALPPATDIELDDLRAGLYERHETLLEQRAALTQAPNCEDPNGGFGFGHAGFGPGGGGPGSSTIGTGSYGRIGPTRGTPAGLRGTVAGADHSCHNQTPLLLVDPQLPAARLVELLSAFDHAMLGVTVGPHVRTLALDLDFLAGNVAFKDRGELLVTVSATGMQAPSAPVDGMWTRIALDGDVTAETMITAIAGLITAKAAIVAFGEPMAFEAPGYGTGSYGASAVSTSNVLLPTPTIEGTYDKATLRRYLKRNLVKLRYCYEKELLAQPKLAGTVEVVFTIQPNGTVGDSTASGVDEHLSTCMAGVVKNIEFPKPKDGQPAKVQQAIDVRPVGK